MKIKLGSLIEAKAVIDSLLDKEHHNTVLAYRIAKFSLSIQNDCDAYMAATQSAIKKYGILNEDGTIRIPNENMKELNEEMNKLKNTELDAPNIKFSLSEISKEFNLSIRQMMSIMDFVEDDIEKH